MSTFKRYKRRGHAEMRPYVPGEDLSKISVSLEDVPREGGFIARNPDNHGDQWYVTPEWAEANYYLQDGFSF